MAIEEQLYLTDTVISIIFRVLIVMLSVQHCRTTWLYLQIESENFGPHILGPPHSSGLGIFHT